MSRAQTRKRPIFSPPLWRVVGLFAILVLCATPGVASAAPGVSGTAQSTAANSNFLQQETGYSASQLESRSVCGHPAPGTMSCLAQVLSVKSTGKPARLEDHPHGTPATLVSRHSYITSSVANPEAAAPSATVGSSTPPEPETPEYLQWAYDLGALSASRGIGDTVAIVDAYNDPNAGSDLAAWRSAFGLPTCSLGSCFRVYNQTGGEIDAGATAPSTYPQGDGDWQMEESLDVQAVSALCPDCDIVLVEAASTSNTNLMAAAAEAKALGANQISMSFGSDTQAATGTAAGTWSYSGIASLAASGDDGYDGSGYVSYPAAQADVTAIGGTSLMPYNNARGFQETVWNTGSTDATSSGCDIYQTIPSYQNGIKSSDGCGGRAYNDISADANPNTGLDVYDSYGSPSGDWIVVGGTSLSTPLTAAYEAITGIDATGGLAQVSPDPTTKTLWPAWAYTYAAELNDVTSGSDATSSHSCTTVICVAQTGWDGPSGNGSISGDVVTGSPQVGGTYATWTSPQPATTETLNGGIYPNGTGTTYQWEYGTSTSYGSTYPSTPASVGNGSTLQAVSTTIPGLTYNQAYHYRLDITFTSGSGSCTIYGYDNSFTAGATSSSTDDVGASYNSNLGSSATANSGACSSLVDSFNGSSSGSGSVGTGSTGATTAPPVTAVSGGTTTGSSGSSTEGEIVEPTESSAPTVTSLPIVGSQIRLSGGKFVNSTSQTVQFYRCAHTCALINTGGASRYTLRTADAGHYIKLVLTVNGEAGSTPLVATDWIGPIRSVNAGAATLTTNARVASVTGLFGTNNRSLAAVRVTRHSGGGLTVAITKPTSAPRTQVWAFVIAGGDVVSCTTSHVVRGTLKLDATLASGQTLKLVAVRS